MTDHLLRFSVGAVVFGVLLFALTVLAAVVLVLVAQPSIVAGALAVTAAITVVCYAIGAAIERGGSL